MSHDMFKNKSYKWICGSPRRQSRKSTRVILTSAGVMNRSENALCRARYVKDLELSGPLHSYSPTSPIDSLLAS